MTVYAPQPIMRTWETVGIGIALATLAWLVISIGPPAARSRTSPAARDKRSWACFPTANPVWLGTGGVPPC